MKQHLVSVIRFLVVVSMVLGTFLETRPALAAALPAEINKQFTPLQIDAGGTSRLRISIFNPNVFPLTNVAFADNLIGVQPGLFVDTPNGVTNTCGGTATAVPGSTSVSLSGGAVPAQVGSNPGQCYIEINVSSVTSGNLINTINVGQLTANGVDGGVPVVISNTTPASATITVIAVSPPSMTKLFNPTTIFVGATSTLTITINNNDVDTNLTGATYTDTLPAGLQVAGAATTAGCGAGTVSAPVGGTTITLTGATVTPSVDCVVTLTVRGVTAGAYLNRIPAGPGGPGSLQTDQGVTNTGNVDANLNVQPVGVTKLFSPLTIDAGDTTTLTITLQNPIASPQPVTSVLDTLPADLTIVGVPATNCGVGSSVVYDATPPARWVFTNGVIPAAAAPPTPNTCTITVTLQASFTSSGTRTNTIGPNSVSSPTPGFTNYNTTSSTVTINPALTGAKTYAAPQTIPLNGVILLTITLNNNSSTPFTDVDFTDTLPANLTVATTSTTPAAPANPTTTCTDGVAPNPTVSNTATSATLTNGEIAANSSCTITFYVTSSVPGTGTTYENSIPAGSVTACTASLGCVGNPDITTGTDLTVINAPQLPVSVAKSFLPTVIAAGQTSRVRITITAPLDIAVSQINITDTLPAGLLIAPNTPPTPAPTETCPGGTLTAVPGTNTITFTNLVGNSLAAGTSCNIDVYVIAANPGIYDNIVPANTITTSQGRTNVFDSNTATLRVTGLNASKAFYPPVVQANGISRMTITLENSFPEALVNVDVLDNLPGSVTTGVIVAPTPDPITTCGGTVTATPGTQIVSLTGGTIPAQVGGVPGLCTISVNVQGKDTSPASPSTQVNTIPTNQIDGDIVSLGVTVNPTNPATATLIIRNLSIGVVKGFDPVLVYGGATSTMTVRLINPETTTLTGVAFTDNMALLSAGIILANPPDFNTGTCGGSLTGNPGDSSFSFSGGTILPNSFCELTLKVVMNVNGNRTNRIPAGAVTTANGTNNTQSTEASLTNLPGVSVNKVFNPNPVQINQVSTLTINITNTSTIPVVNMSVFDNLPGSLPDGLAIANPPNASNTCNGTLTANAGSQAISLTGGSIAGSASCQISVDVVSVSPGVYVNTIPPGGVTADGGVTNNDPTTDTLTVGTLFSLGNRVWLDTNNNSLIGSGEVGLDGVVVQLYAANAGGQPTGPVLGTQTTNFGGYYRFDNLPEGDYVVVIPRDNFMNVGAGDLAPSDPLAGYWSSATSLSGASTTETIAPDPDNDIDSDDNGTRQTFGAFTGAVISSAVTLGTNAVPAEPTNDTDAPTPNPAGESANNRSNRTVDFGFYRISIGNLVYFDANANGTYAGTDTPLAGAVVQLFASDGITEINVGLDGIFGTSDDAAGGVTTGANGLYSFVGLPAGNYIVRVTPPPGYVSTVDTSSPTDTTDPDFNIDNNDNGIGSVVGPANWSSGVLTVTAGEIGPNITVTNATGSTVDLTVDFGFVSNSYSLGNRVWFDTDNSSTINGTEVGVPGVRVNLYQDNGTTPGVYDAGDTFLSFDTTDPGGYYRFDGLAAGNYVVTIPADNFRNVGVGDTVAGDPLASYWSSGTTISAAGAVTEAAAPDPDNDTDSDDNGGTIFNGNSINYVASLAVTLGPGTTEPAADNDPATNPESGEAPNNRSNRTVDFGFYNQQLGNLVFADVNANGTFDAGDTPLAGATVQLFSSNGTEINVGPDGIFGTADDTAGGVTTGAGGTYQFGGLPQGDYIVRATPPAIGTTSTVDTASAADTTDPDTNTDNNDNGIGTSTGQVSSGVVTLTPGQGTGGTAGAANNIVTNSTGTTADPTVDFGFIAPVGSVSLGSTVFFDNNNNGLQDVGETGISGVLLELYFSTQTPGVDTPLTTDTTDVNGNYFFSGLAPGSYIVYIPVPPASAPTSSSAAVTDTADNSQDSDDNGTQAVSGQPVTSPVIALTVDGETITEPGQGGTQDNADDNNGDMTVDFGFIPTANLVSLGSTVFFDNNDNGLQDVGETGISGVVLELYTNTQTPGVDTPIATDTTDVNGDYFFSGLPAGSYVVYIPTPPASAPSSSSAAVTDTADNSQDSDDNGIQASSGQPVRSPVIVLTVNGETITEPGQGGTQDNADDNNGDMTVDFGFIPTANLVSLGSTVFFDNNDNGLQDVGETGISGVTIELYRSTQTPGVDTPVATDTTDVNGDYFFSGLLPGSYIVYIPTPPASAPTSSSAGVTDTADNSQDSDDNGTQASSGQPVTSPVIALTVDGETITEPGQGGAQDNADDNNGDMTVDFGFIPVANLVSLGSTVFFDNNDNGLQDVGETGISGVAVQLYLSTQTPGVDTPVATDTTDLNGDYFFGGLVAGSYIVYIPTPPVSAPTSSSAVVTDTADNSQDNDDNGTQAASGQPVTSPVILLTVNGETITEPGQGGTQDDADDNNGDMTVDFGFIPTANLVSLGSTVFFDNNNNGLQDVGETGIGGVPVELYLSTQTPGVDTPVATDTTDGSGNYFFSGLTAGSYIVYIPTPPASAPTSSSPSVTDTADNSQDSDDNGTQASSGQPVTSPVIVLTVNGETITEPGQGGTQDNTDDNNGDMTVDFGFIPTANLMSLGSTVFFDNNDNGLQDIGETGISGVAIELYRSTQTPGVDTPIATDTTDVNGDYFFSGLAAGGYVVYIPTPPATAPTSSSAAVTDTADNSQDNDDNGTQTSSGQPVTSPVITLAVNGETITEPGQGGTQDNADDNNGDMTVDFGFIPTASLVSLGSTVFFDNNDNGLQDVGETGISGVLVQLYRSTQTPGVDTPIATDTTDVNGDYFFSGLIAGSYIVYIPTPPASAPTSSSAAVTDTADNSQDSDDNGTQASSGQPVISPIIALTVDGETITEPGQGGTQDNADDNNGDMTVDFGFIPAANLVSLGSTVFFDNNDNGLQDVGETGISGVAIQLYRSTQTPGVDTPVATDTTDVNGDYFFSGLAAGSYVVYIPTPPASAPTSSSAAVTDTADNSQDSDDNGTQVSSGQPVSSPVITLTVNGETVTEPGQGGTQDDADDNNGDMTVDFGFIPAASLVSLGSTVFGDTNDNGLQDASESGISGVTLELYLSTQTPGVDTPVATSVTNAVGNYYFGGLLPGSYVVYIPTPPPAAPVSSSAAVTDTADNSEDNDDNGTQTASGQPVTSPIIVLTLDGETTTEPGQGGAQDNADDNNGDMTVDFGFIPNASMVSLGSTVFADNNDNGLQDTGEVGIGGVTIELYRSTQTPGVDVPIATDVTDVNGDYFFSGLPAGSYILYIPTPPGTAPLSSSPAVTDTADNSQDSDDNGIQSATGQPVTSPLIVLTVDGETSTEPGQGGTQDNFDDNNGDMTVDFGFVPTASLVADPALAKSGNPSRASVGETVVFTLRVTNQGNANASNVVVNDPLPAIFDVVSVTSVFQAGGSAGTVSVSAGPAPFTVTVSLPTLATTDVVIITITTTVNSRGNPPIVNSAFLTTAGSNRLISNDASAASISTSLLPNTGFAPNVTTVLPPQPEDLKYAATDVILEIPSLGIKIPVVGIPKKDGTWDVSWLGSQAGWLDGTAFPSWSGNSVLTSHVYLPNGLPGPFVNLGKLKYGDKIIIHAYGQRYIFEVRTNNVIAPEDASIIKHEELPWLTLLTCKEYDEKTNTYKKRVSVRAVLVKVEPDK